MIKILAYLFFQSFFIGRNVYPCEFISVSHDRADISVSQIKTRSTISCSTSCTSPSSAPSLIIALISSSVTFPSSLGFMPNNFKTKAVLFVNNITNGAAIFDIKYIGLDTMRATRSAAAYRSFGDKFPDD